jgi:hypothetical protein
MQEAITAIASLSEQYNDGYWLTDNYNYRALAQGHLLSLVLGKEVVVHRHRRNASTTIDGVQMNVDFKSGTLNSKLSLNNLKASFDPRYEYTDGSCTGTAQCLDIMVVSAFDNECVIPRATIIVLKNGVSFLLAELSRRLAERKGKANELAILTAADIIRMVPNKYLVFLFGSEQVTFEDFLSKF